MAQQRASVPGRLSYPHHAPLSWLAALLIVTLVVAIDQWHFRAWNAGYGAYPDEPAHFVGGLMVRDYLRSGSGSPLAFARNYYLFQPYFAIGYWPPLFYVIEGIWMLVAGYSRISMMVLTGSLTALVALVMLSAVRHWVSAGLALTVALSFLAIPSVKWSSSVVMTDMCMTLFCLAATLAAGRYFETRSGRWAILTGLAASLAILTKYLAVFVLIPPALLILIDCRWDLIRSTRTWSSVGVILVLCGPWVLWARKFALIGFDFHHENLWRRILDLVVVLRTDLGIVLGTIAILTAFWGLSHWRRLTATHRLLLLQLPCVAALVVVGPSGIEQRYLLAGYPGMLAVIALAIDWAGSRKKFWRQLTMSTLVAIMVTGFASNKYGSLPGGIPRQVARDLLTDWRSGAILVPTAMEGSLIAEMAGAEAERSRIMLIRPTKLLAGMTWLGGDYRLLVPNAKAMASLFDQYPVDTIVLAVLPGQAELPHDTLLRQVLTSDTRWQVRHKYAEPGGGYWEVYSRPAHSDEGTAALIALMRTRLRAIQ